MNCKNRSFTRSVFLRFGAILTPMNKITTSFTGLASSLLLNVGLTKAAEKLDPVTQPATQVKAADALSAELCTYPCNFTRDTGL